MPYVVFLAAPPIDQLKNMHDFGRHHNYSSKNLTVSFINNMLCVKICVLNVIYIYKLFRNVYESMYNACQLTMHVYYL